MSRGCAGASPTPRRDGPGGLSLEGEPEAQHDERHAPDTVNLIRPRRWRPPLSVGGPGQDVAMTVTARLDLAIFDAADIEKLGSFYAELTGWDVVRKDSDRFGLRTPDGQEIEFQRAPDHVAPRWPGQERPQQVHLDLQTGDPQSGADRAVGLGATRLADGPTWI